MELHEHVSFEERTIEIRRVSRVMEGGKRMSFRALVVVGDGRGRVGAAIGKALGVPEAIRKAAERAKRELITVPMLGDTIPHEVWGEMKSTRVLLKPAAPGTGVIASGPVRAVLELAGIRNILTKVYGSRNPINVIQATLDALRRLRSPQEIAQMRGKSVRDLPIPRKLRRWLEQHAEQKTSPSDLGA
ncbi:MAG: 30S ribosomal protein S5 [Armatimonadetes bacterium]|nr:30S ribosomal protein S5 [Armatimonadota bacterium]MCX7967375.1 30S ribosomal protein S5 [Armatimonadota bacterium]MDW8142359.1 30S ribosomal protein S5 [Armatimonadota bacterium]